MQKLCCLKYSGSHKTPLCDNLCIDKCANSVYSNFKYKTNLEVNYIANGTKDCAIFKRKLTDVQTRLIIEQNLPYPHT